MLAEEERLLEALVFEPPLFDALDLFPPLLFAAVLERGLLFDALLVFAPLLLFDALLVFAPPLLFEGLERRDAPPEPLELCELFFWRLDEPLFACAISPPWVFDNFGLEKFIPRSD